MIALTKINGNLLQVGGKMIRPKHFYNHWYGIFMLVGLTPFEVARLGKVGMSGPKCALFGMSRQMSGSWGILSCPLSAVFKCNKVWWP